MISAGKILYKAYHQPVGYVKKLMATGLRRNWQLERGRADMMAAATQLREVVYPHPPVFTVYFLTGKKYWYQTAFCLYSLQRQAGINIQGCLVDDGSFDEELQAKVLAAFPATQIVRSEQLQQLLDQHLPQLQYPVLRQKRLSYPHLRKLTDIHILPGKGPKLVLDSDMLFFKKPNALLQWLQQPDGLLFMKDVQESYGYSRPLMRELTGGREVPKMLNVGVAGMPSSLIDWALLERWTADMLAREGSSYLQEQALTAMLATASHLPIQFLDARAYKVMPRIGQGAIPEILHHYVADAKYDYFVKGWKAVLNPS